MCVFLSRHTEIGEGYYVQNVGLTPEGIGEDGDGLQVDIRVVARGLTGGGTVKVPHGKIGGNIAALLLGESLEYGVVMSAI